MKQELISLAKAINELSVYRGSKEEALTEITHLIRNKKIRAYATSRGWIIIERLDKRGNGNYYIETNESYSIEGFITPCELPLLEVAHSIHLIKLQFMELFKLSNEFKSPLINLPAENKRDPVCLLIIHAYQHYFQNKNSVLADTSAFDYALSLVRSKDIPISLGNAEITRYNEIKFESIRPTNKKAFNQRIKGYSQK
jgi:hypothetical protein